MIGCTAGSHDRWADIQIGRNTDRQTDRYADIQIGRPTGRQTYMIHAEERKQTVKKLFHHR